MGDDGLYVSMQLEEYKKSKEKILKSQVDLLNSAKRLNNIRKIKIEKSKIQLQMHKMISGVLLDMEKLENQLPQPKVPKSLLAKPQVIKQPLQMMQHHLVPQEHEDFENNNQIENELQSIQEKLMRLNG